MKRILRISEDSTISNDDFDTKWEERFGQPSTEVFDSIDDFQTWMEEVENFEVSSN